MSVQSPQDVYPLLYGAINSGDAGAIRALYTEDAVMRIAPGQVAQGRAAVGEALDAFVALKGTIEGSVNGVVESPATAITYGSWSLSATGEDGNPTVLSGEFTDVLAKQPGGNWLIVIDDPQGSAGNA